jgi:hypothetical protein
VETTLDQPRTSKAVTIIGWILALPPVGLMLMSAYFKLARVPMAVEGFQKAGYADRAILYIGIAEVACVLLYLVPQTAVLGAILMAGYLGGAACHHVRSQEAFIAPILLGVVAWLGLYLRDRRVRALVPIRRSITPAT